MTTAPVLAHPDTTRSYIMYTDASNIGIGASLHQLQPDKSIRPIAYASRKLIAAERNYCTSDKEALAVVYGFDKFHHYVHGTCTELHTDHRALISALNNPDPRGRIARWNSALQAYDYTIKHIKGLENGLTDALSRDFKDDNSETLKISAAQTRSQGPPKRTIRRFGQLDVLADSSSDDDINSGYTTYDNSDEDEIENNDWQQSENNPSIDSSLPSVKMFIKMQLTDANTKKIIDNLKGKTSTNYHSEKQLKHYKIVNKVLYNVSDAENLKLYVPKSLIKSVIFHHHDTPMMSHLGHRRTLDKIKQTFYWPKMSRDVFGYIQTCKTCQLTKHSTQQTPGELQPIIVSEPFEMVSIDFAGPFPETESGNRYILVVTDLLTRWVDAVAVPNTTAEITVDILEKRLISLHGCPQKLLSDNGAAFTSQLMNAFCINYGIKQVFSSPYHPETNGMTERFNRTMKAMIKAYTTEDQSKWDQHLDMHLYAYRTAKHETLGLSPFEALYGRKPKLPASNLKPANPNAPLSVIAYEQLLQSRLDPIRQTIISNNKHSKEAMELRYNKRHRAVQYQVGDFVLLKRQTKEGLNSTLGLSTVYTGPFRVAKKIGRVSYLLIHTDEDGYKTKRTAHVSKLKPYNSRTIDEARPMGEEGNVTIG
ncbi:Transposon Tf2-6 polyprotein [Smittium culicis]|uniref:Transposon Tf2-6 polyprotein n=1 Tax=Smittium culicis TaxID=133412 RepID=A0A1R1XG68_9FUNG|nr:Transposon Tf2-6 polyprotein [Smittium culicis]